MTINPQINWNCSGCKKDWLSWLPHFHIFFQVLQSVPCWSFGSQKKSKVWDKKIDAEVQVSSISTSFKHGFFRRGELLHWYMKPIKLSLKHLKFSRNWKAWPSNYYAVLTIGCYNTMSLWNSRLSHKNCFFCQTVTDHIKVLQKVLKYWNLEVEFL